MDVFIPHHLGDVTSAVRARLIPRNTLYRQDSDCMCMLMQIRGGVLRISETYRRVAKKFCIGQKTARIFLP